MMLGRLRRWRYLILREAGLLRQYLRMNRSEVAAVGAVPPLPVSWEDSLRELQVIL